MMQLDVSITVLSLVKEEYYVAGCHVISRLT